MLSSLRPILAMVVMTSTYLINGWRWRRGGA